MTDISRSEMRRIARKEAEKALEEQLGGSLVDSGSEQSEAEQLAETQMNVSDLRVADEEGLSAREYVEEYLGVDPAECESEAELRRKIGMMD
jgi:hypothetical protein